MLVVGVKNSFGCEAGCGLTIILSEQFRHIIWSNRPHFVHNVSFVFGGKKSLKFPHSFCVVGAVFGDFGCKLL